MTRRQYVALSIILGLTLIGASQPALANACEFDEIAIFATNSIKIGTGSAVTGNVVANNASPGPVLDEGVELALDRNAVIIGDASAVSVDLDNGASVSGTLTCASGDAACTGLVPPVFVAGDIPVFLEADVRPDAEDILVGDGETVYLGDEGFCSETTTTECSSVVLGDCPGTETCVPGRVTSYGDIVVNQGGTLVFFGGGRFDVRSITGTSTAGQCSPCRSIEFGAPTELRIEGRFDAERGAYVGPPVGSGIDASDITIDIGGQNGATGGLFELPRAANIGRDSVVAASFYVPNGTFELEKNSTMSGAVLAADVQIDKDSTFTGDSAFANKPPTADDKDAFTNDQASIAIGLTGSDPEGQVLTFGAGDGSFGSVSVAGSTATYTPNDQFANAEDSFTYTATDACGEESAPATVRINPPGDPNDPPDDPTTVVVANDQLCASTNPIDCSLETTEGTAITIILTGAAPCEGGFPTLPDEPNDEQPCDGMGNDVPLTFSLPSTTTSQNGTLTLLNQGTGELQEPPGADEVPQRTASVLYTPPVSFTGVDSFTFDVEGDVDDSGGISGAGETDSATIEISVQTFTPVPPVEARDQEVSTQEDTPVEINLSGAAGTCDPNDEDCRKAFNRPPTPKIGKTATEEALAKRQAYAASSTARRVWAFATKASSSDLATAMGIGTALISSSSISGDSTASAALSNLGVISPTQGSSFALLSTGVAGACANGATPPPNCPQGGTSFGTSGPEGNDPVVLTLTLNVQESGVISFDYNFLSAEYPEFVLQGVNDTFIAQITDNNGTREVASEEVDKAAFVPVSAANAGDSGFDIFTPNPDAGLTGFRTASEPFVPDGSGQITLSFSIADKGDFILDSAVILDNVAFVEQSGFSIITLPEDPQNPGTVVGTLSYFNPLTGVQTDITAGDLPLLLPTEQVTYTPPDGATGEPLASFTFGQTDGITSDTGIIDLFVSGVVIIVDSCAEVGRPPGCEGSSPSGEPFEFVDTFDGPSDGLTFIVEGAGTVTSSPVPLAADRILMGLNCSSECTKEFPVGSVVRVFARPDGGSEFVGWDGDCWGDGQIGTIQLAKQTLCKAVFRQKATD